MDKLRPELITLDPDAVAGVQRVPHEHQVAMQKEAEQANKALLLAKGKESALAHKAKGKSKPSKQHRKKRLNIIEVKSSEVEKRERQKLRQQQQGAGGSHARDGASASALGQEYVALDENMPRALARFVKKK